MNRRLAPAVLLAVALVVVLAGCAREIDQAKAEKYITKAVGDEIGAKVKSVDCPSGLTAKKGETFECTVVGTDGSKGTTKVIEKDDKGSVGVSAPFIHPTEIEDSIEKGITAQVGSDVALECPEIIVAKKGDTFDCKATSGSDKATVRATQTDGQGHVRYKIVRQ